MANWSAALSASSSSRLRLCFAANSSLRAFHVSAPAAASAVAFVRALPDYAVDLDPVNHKPHFTIPHSLSGPTGSPMMFS